MCSIDSARRYLSKNDVRAHALDLTRYGFSHISNFLAQKSPNHPLLCFSDQSQTLRFSDLTQTHRSNNRLPKHICTTMTKKKTPIELLMVAPPVILRNTMRRTNVREGGLINGRTKNRKRGARQKVKAPTSNTKKKKKLPKIQGTSCSLYRQTRIHYQPLKVKAVVSSTFSCSVKINSLLLCISNCCNASS